MTESRRYVQSQFAFDRAAAIPGRSCTRSKAPGKFFDIGAGPLYASGARGCRLVPQW